MDGPTILQIRQPNLPQAPSVVILPKELNAALEKTEPKQASELNTDESSPVTVDDTVDNSAVFPQSTQTLHPGSATSVADQGQSVPPPSVGTGAVIPALVCTAAVLSAAMVGVKLHRKRRG